MKFTFGGITYHITFAYGTEPVARYNGKNGMGQTVFTIAKITNGDTVAASAKVTLFNQDEYDEEVGRKEALTKALTAALGNREFRKSAWNAYNQRPGGVADPLRKEIDAQVQELKSTLRKKAYSERKPSVAGGTV